MNVPGEAAKKGSSSPKLQSYRGTAEKCKFEGETVRHFNAGKLAVFELKAPGHKREDVEVSIISKLLGLLIASRKNYWAVLLKTYGINLFVIFRSGKTAAYPIQSCR